MKTYTVLYAEDVPHYGVIDIDASDHAAALTIARATNFAGVALDPDYENATCKRIVHIADEAGDIIVADIALDSCFLRYGGESERKLCDAAPALLKALQDIAATILCGEPIADLDQKAELAEAHEYDLENDCYNPCVDSESTALTQAVETARTVLAKLRSHAA